MIKLYLVRRLLTMLFVAALIPAWGQSKTVTGKVNSGDDGTPLPGVSIIEKGTTNGTVTDADGNFSIRTTEDAVLVFSFVGYKGQEVPVAGQTSVTVVLETDITALNEVVVIGYGEQKREDVTGSVVAVTSRDFNKGVMSSPQDLLVGKVAGVVVTSSGGAPGSGSTIRIRGGSSLRASNDPLIVIDGFPVDNSGIAGSPNALASINPNDIESFTVLKDASATAIYGSRASNGVIIITTKKGAQDKFQLGYNGTFSASKPIDYIDVMSGDEVRALAADLLEQGFSGLSPAALNRLGDENTDWQKEIYRTAISHDHNVNASGAIGENTTYRVSYGYTDQQGILKQTEMKRHTIGFNFNPTLLNDQLRINANLKTSFANHNFGNQGAIGSAVAYDPTQPVRNGNTRHGGYFTWTLLDQALPDGSNNPEGDRNPIGVSNPVALLEQTHDESDVTRTIANLQADYRFPFMPELRVNINGGFDKSTGEGFRNFEETAAFIAADQGLTDYTNDNSSELLDLYFNYVKDFNGHGVDATAGYSWQHFQREGSNFQRSFDEATVRDNSRYKNENFLVSFFGRLNYSYKDRYLLTASLRNDGSSRFGEENRWGLFPAFALAWNISNESFLKGVKAISNAKLRLGYGVTGQQDIGPNYYPYLATYTESQNGASYQFGNQFYNTLRPEAYDANIKWEETTTYNAGLDIGFMNGRLTASVDYYQRTTDNLINYIPIPAGSNFSNFLLTNVGSLENKGVEVTLNAKVVEKGSTSWNVGLNVSRNENEITKLIKTNDPSYPGVARGGISGGVGNFIQNDQVGYPVASFYVFQQVYYANGKPIEGLYVDRTGEGGVVISNELNKYHYKKPAADVVFGLFSSARYQNFDLYFAGRLSLGNYVYNNVFSNRAVYSALYNQSGFWNNLPTAVNDTQFNNPQYFSDYYIEDASFFKMDNISLGYNFDQFGNEKLKMRLSFTVQNAFTITDYSGLDPEVDGGIDNNFYPRPRVYLFGLNLTY